MQFMAPFILLALASWSADASRYPYHVLQGWILHGYQRLRQVIIAQIIAQIFHHPGQTSRHYRRTPDTGTTNTIRRSRAKPAWVKHEVLRLKALMPDGTCRKIRDCFNQRFGCSRQMTVGKTYVSETIRKHLYEIQKLRKQLRNAKPRSVPVNWVWGMDLTGKTDTQGVLHMLLGILDHGSRALLCLRALPNKLSWTLFGELFLAIGKYGKPRFVRTDNEAVFCSRLFRGMLSLLGVRHQRTDPGCPWQNGRIERFFGTLKERLDRLTVASFDSLNSALVEFRFFYNHVRSHQHLGGATPAQTWAGINPLTTGVKQEFWFEAWDGLLQGYYLRR